jgi:hypothetical protein
VAGLGVGRPAPPAVQDSLEKNIQTAGALVMVGCCVAATLCPGILLGATAYALWRWLRSPSLHRRIRHVALPTVMLFPLRAAIVVAWPWRDVFAGALPFVVVKGVDPGRALVSFFAEALAGPLAFELGRAGHMLMRRSLGAQMRRDQRSDQRRWRAVGGRRQLHSYLPNPRVRPEDVAADHPSGRIRLGVDRETELPFDLELPRDLASHVFMPGVTGAGKTNTLTRLLGGALANGYGAILVDCKGTDLRGPARLLAERHRLPFYLVDPDDPASLGYNPCSGDASAVANKLVGAFSYGPSAEIYKNIAMEAVPLMVCGLLAAGDEVTLEALYEACGPRGMTAIAKCIPEGADDRVRERLLTLGGATDADKLGKSGHKGLQRRLGALLEGKFGHLFRADRMLDWDVALSQPSVTYVALSTLATSEDVELMGRVIAQDLKQVCARRLTMLSRGEHVTPAIAVIDEFAALREADQLSDLLRQARAALMPTIVSTQYVPENFDLRKSVMGAGLLICHRVESEDANALAEALGTRTRTELTNQLDFETGFAQKGSIRHVQAYVVHPNELRDFSTGYVAVRSAVTGRHAIVHVHRDAT